jgi:hypothetical protein
VNSVLQSSRCAVSKLALSETLHAGDTKNTKGGSKMMHDAKIANKEAANLMAHGTDGRYIVYREYWEIDGGRAGENASLG